MLARLVCSLIEEKRITTTLPRAREAGRMAERLVTLARRGGVAARRRAAASLRREPAVKALFDEIAPRCEGRAGGYTRVVKLGERRGDKAPVALVEWVGVEWVSKKKKPAEPDKEAPGSDAKPAAQ